MTESRHRPRVIAVSFLKAALVSFFVYGSLSTLSSEQSFPWAILITAVITLVVLLISLRSILRPTTRCSFVESEILRETTATVIAKKQFTFFAGHASDTDTDAAGERFPVQASSDQWRVYYRIDDFQGLDVSIRADLQKAEQAMEAAGHSRFELKSKEWYDKIEVGAKLRIVYEWRAGTDITVTVIENPDSQIDGSSPSSLPESGH